MLEILGANYYIDIDAAIEVCRPIYHSKNVTPNTETGTDPDLEQESDPELELEPEVDSESLTDTGDIPDFDGISSGGEINIFKFEIIKGCIERALGEYEPSDNNIGAFAESSMSSSFKIAFNTLLKYEILKEENE